MMVVPRSARIIRRHSSLPVPDRSTVEYEITGLKIVRGSSCLSNHTLDKVSTACVKVVFRRKLAYHISNTYLQVIPHL